MKIALVMSVMASMLFVSVQSSPAQKIPVNVPEGGSRTPCGLTSIAYDWDFSQGQQGFMEVDCDGLPSPGLWEYGWTDLIPGVTGNVWGTVLNGDYYNSTGDGLISPWILVTEQSRFVEVTHYFSTEPGYDGCNVSAGAGGWPNNTIIHPIGGYNTSQINGSTNYYAYCVDGEPGWSGYDATWRVDCFDLSAFMNLWVKLEFDFGADESVTAPGWYISKVQVGGMGAPVGACCDMSTGACTIKTQTACVNGESGSGDWHGEWTTCDPNPCPQPIPYGEVTMGAWSDAEPWHDWVSSMPGSTLSIELHPGVLTGQIQSVDFFTSIDQGWSWQYAGTDADGREPRLNTIDPTVVPGGDGWALTVPIPDLPPDSPFQFKALAHTPGGDHVARGTTRVDPAPPTLGTSNVHDWVVTDRDTMGVDIQPNGTEIREIILFRGEKVASFTKGIPGIDQHILGDDYCAPTAAAECLKYFESQGDHTVTGDLSNPQLVANLAEYMQTVPVIGTYPSNWWGGLQSWIDDHGNGYTIRQIRHYTRRGSPTWQESDWKLMRNELERCQDVLVGVFWQGGGAHAMTLDAILNTALPNGRILLGFKDPWTGQTSQGELDTGTGLIYNMTGAGGGQTGYAGITMIASPKEPAVNEGGPGFAIYDGLPPGEPPYHITVQLPQPGTWFLHMVLVNTLGHAARSSYVVVRQGPGGVGGDQAAPAAFALGPGNPNPFRFRTDLSYAAPEPSTISLVIYDVTGRKIRTLVDGEVAAGTHQASWDGTDGFGRAVSPGEYFVRMRTGAFTQTRTLTLLR